MGGYPFDVNGFRLLKNKFGISSLFTRWYTHASAGTTLQCLCTLQGKKHFDAKAVYENLRSVFKLFAMSQKISEHLR